MKKIYALLTALILIAASSFSLKAQCPYNNSIYVTLNAPNTLGASIGTGDCIYPGEYYRVTGMQAGSIYRISTCTTTDVADTRITVYAQGGAGGAITFNDDFCGLLSRVDFAPTTTGSYDILVDQTGPGNTCTSINECVEMVITLIGTSGSTEYCIPTYVQGTANGDFINGVSLGSINNQNSGSVGGPNYSNFTNLSTVLNSSTAYTLSVRNNPDFQEIASAWIDYNQDFQFSENERLGQVSINANATGLINFTTPANVLPGNTRMRVRMVFSVAQTGGSVPACGSANFGETEDYTVTFTTSGPPIGPGALSFSTNCGIGATIQDNACPNPTLASVDVGGLSSLGTNHVLTSAEIIITHPMAADLDLFLVAPNGAIVELSTDNGGSGANYGIYSIGNCTQSAIFSMAASTPIAGSSAPFVGTYLPEGNLNDFNAGVNPNGLWRLRACDDFAGDVGTIEFFKLNFSLNATEPPACADSYTIPNGAANITLDQNISWTSGAGNPTSYDVFLGTDVGNLILESDNQAGTTFSPGVLLASTTYFYQIVPSNNAGDATGCPVNSFTTVAEGTAEILMANGDVTVCSGNFFDSGGANDNYSNNETFLLSIYPSTPNSAVQVTFSSFLIDDLDLLVAVDGPDEFSDVIGIYSGDVDPGTITATNPQGVLSFFFLSDDIINFSGWEATISCVPTGAVPACVTVSSPLDQSLSVGVNTQVSWTAPIGNATDYDVYFGTNPNPALAASGVVTESYNPGALLNETTYYYQIVPANGNGSAEGCPILSFTTVVAAANVVLMQNGDITICDGFFYDSGNSSADYGSDESFTLTLTPETSGSAIQVSFDSFQSEDGFDVLNVYSGTGTGGLLLGSLTGSPNLLPTFTSLSPNGALTFVFSSDFQVSNTGWASTIACVQLPTVPECAVNLNPADESLDVAEVVTLTWEAGNGNPTAYDVYFGTDGQNLTLVSEGQSGTSYETNTLTGETTYFWQVVPSNLVGSAIDCSVLSFTTAAQGTAPSCVLSEAPSNAAVDVNVNGSISWSAGAGDAPTSYDVYFGTDSGNLALVSEGQTETSYTPANQNFETTYFWTVIPSNSFGSATDCPVFSFTTAAEVIQSDIIQQDGSVAACSGNYYDSGSIDGDYASGESSVLTINPEIAGNLVQVTFTSFDVEGGWDFLTIYDGNSTSAPLIGSYSGIDAPGTILSTAADGSLTFEFTSDASFALSGWEATVSCVDPNQAPSCAVDFAPSDASTDVSVAVALSWATGDGVVVGYDVYFGTDAGNLVLVSEGQVATSFSPGALELSTTYFWQVVPVGTVASAEGCSIQSFTTEATANILMQNASISICSGNFFDSGNADANYSSNENLTLTMTPSIPGNALQVIFSAFDLEQSTFNGIIFDSLLVYNGPDATSALIGIFSGTTIPGPFVSTHPSGALTFYFSSDASVTRAGWEASISCIDPNLAPSCATNFVPANLATEILVAPSLTWSSGGGVVVSYDVFFGTDPDNLILVSAAQAGTSFNPGALELNTIYYWQVIPNGENASAENCAVQSFTTQSVATILQQEGSITICAANFFDSGGATGAYSANETSTFVITPEIPGNVIEVIFNTFAIENNFEFLSIYDGNSTAAPLIGEFTGAISPGSVVSTASDGSLTFVFTSDSSVQQAGWSASVNCIDPNAAPNCATSLLPVTGSAELSLANFSVSWISGGGGVTGYDVYFGTDAGSLTLVSANQVGLTYTPADLALNTTYFWQVVALNETGAAIDCPINSFTTSTVQDVVMSNATVTTCSANFFDSGAASGNYQNNESSTLTFLPDQANNAIQVIFDAFDLEQSTFNNFIFDSLLVYDGPDATSTLIGIFSGTTIPGPFISSHPTGALTFYFSSDASVTRVGWSALVSCVPTEGVPNCIASSTPADLAVDVNATSLFTWTSGGGVVTGYDVYLGTDPDALVLVSENQIGTSFNPGTLELATIYFWQVIPSNANGSAIDCPVLSFTTAAEISLNIFNGETTLCAGNLFDTGGADGPYQTNENITLTVYPSTPGAFIQADFVSFNVENTFDFLNVFNGNTATGTAIASLTGIAIPATIISSAADGSLTFNFASDFIVTAAGFEIQLSCFTPTAAPSCSQNYIPADAEAAAPLNATLSWSGVGFPTNYDVFFGTDPDNLTLIGDGISTASIDPGDLLPNTQYFWQVTPSNAIGVAEGCPVVSFTTSGSEVIDMFTGTVSTCLAEFYDPQGVNGDYLNNANNTLTVNPASPNNVMRVTFNVFNLENNFDFLTIYAGQTATGTPLATLTNIIAGPIVVTSNSPDGALTFVFTSDASVVRLGWEAVLECVSTTDIPGCVTNAVPADGSVDVSPTLAILGWGLGSGIAFGYDVYFGTDPDALALVSPDQVATTFNPGQLDLNTTYYWQVIPSNATGSAEGCPVNSFTTSGSIDIVMSNTTITTCAANFFDSGNSTGNYLNNENLTLTIFPDQPGNSVQVTFNSFNVEPNWDALYIYNGPDATAPIFPSGNPATIGGFPANGWYGTNINLGSFTSSDPSGALTFVFRSDGSVVRPGWDAIVSCIDATQPPACVNQTGGPLDGATDVCLNEAVLTWTSGTGAPATSYDVYLDFGGGLILVSDNQAGTTFDLGLLEPNTSYSFQIIANNANGSSIDCPMNTFTTGTCLTYCDASATICDEFISDVQMGNINNPTACTAGGYNDYTALSTDVFIGAATPITVTNGNLNWPTDVCGVWIDWNHDGDFLDANEAITMAGSPGTGPYSAQVIAPVDAVVGATTMRVRIQFGGVLDPCGITTFGEVEDYTIIVNAPLACPFPNNINASETTTTSTVITWDENVDALEYSIRYRLVSEDVTAATWVNPIVVPAPLTFTFLENLTICENYILQIASICEIGSTDVVYSSNLAFGTRCIDCTSDLTLEGEDCGTDLNGGCNSTPPAFGSINCGETICATSFMDGSTRDTDWYNFTVTDAGIYQIDILAEFAGIVLIANTADCANIIIPSQANFNAGEQFSLGTSLTPGIYTVIVVPIFEQAVFACSDFSGYTISLSSGQTQIASPGNVCTSTAPFNLFAIPAGGVWSGVGIADAANGTFDASSVGVGSYEITYTPVGAGCSVPATITIDVEEAPVADFVGLASTYCASALDVVLTGIPSGGTFSITPSVVGAIAGNVFIPSLCAPGAYEITYVVSIGSSSCAGSITQSVEILASPVASIDALPSSVCTQDDVITLSGTPANGVFSGNGVVGSTFNPMVSGTGAVEITYTVSALGFECPATVSGTIQVNPSPVVTLSGISGNYCLNSNVATLIGTPALGQFLIDGVPSGASFDPAAAGLGEHTVRYEFDNGTCVGYNEVVVNVVNNITLSFANVPADVCSADDPFILQSNPAGATFSGIGVFGSTFSPKIAGAGSHVITATYSNGNCTATATQTIVVNPSPVASFIYSANGASIAFNNTSLNGTSYSWDFGDGTPASTAVNPTHTYQTNGTYVITLTANSANCGSSIFTATLELSVGIGSIDGVDMIQLYPNPTNGIINLAFNSLNQQSFEVRITDATGRLIAVDALSNYMGKFNQQYDMSDKAKGVYFFTITSEKGSINFRVVRN